ncbi:MAG: TIGR03943 family protein [Litorilinea sp.]
MMQPNTEPSTQSVNQDAQTVRPSPIQNGAKAILLIALGLFLYSRLTGGTLAFYINERFFGYTLFAFVGLIAVGLSYPLIRSHPRRKSAPNAARPQTLTPQTIDYQYHDLAPHDHSRDHRLTLVGALVIALPILLGLLVPPRPLGAAALETRELNLDLRSGGANLPAAIAAVSQDDGPRNIMDWWHTFQRTPDLTTLEGSEVNVQGFVYHDPRYGEEYFMVTRFVVSCCTADASALALLVHWPQAPALETDQWVEVRGVFTPGDLSPADLPPGSEASWRPPVLTAASITPIEIPSHPYLYP